MCQHCENEYQPTSPEAREAYERYLKILEDLATERAAEPGPQEEWDGSLSYDPDLLRDRPGGES